MVVSEARNEDEQQVVVQRQDRRRRELREEDALRSLNTRSCSRVPPSAARPSSAQHPSPFRRRSRPGLGLCVSSSSTSAMDGFASHRPMSWGPGLLSPLSPTTIESLESRSRDVQERTFCKWYLVRSRAYSMESDRYLSGSTRN